MLSELRRTAGHWVNGGLSDTETVPGHYIELQVRNGADHFLSLYFRSNNLYLDGFTVRGQNYRFSDAPTTLTSEFQRHWNSNQIFTSVGYTGGYVGSAGLDTDGQRANSSVTAPSIFSTFMGMDGFTYQNRNQFRLRLAEVIMVTAEAARLGWIANRIETTIRDGSQWDGERHATTIGGFGIEMQTSWQDFSRLVHRLRAGTARPNDSVSINGRMYRTLDDVFYGRGLNLPALGPLLAQGSAV
ncbi:ribosome-inactivating family protein [Streptomyces goshikiensis]|uniref:ribosome-inactivating family protein n=1 Tax=Streptomyces goshikiensis TaxID=1942 RepID=UPI00364DAD6F